MEQTTPSSPDSIKSKAKRYATSVRAFLSPQSPREQKLVVAYSALAVVATAVINTLLGGGGGSLLGGAGGSKTVFKVDSVLTNPNWGWTGAQNQAKCSELDQSAEYDKLIQEGWKITTTQFQSKPVAGVPAAPAATTGECQGTMFVFSK